MFQGGIAPYAYNWSTGASTEDVTGLSPGFYFCQVADRNGCAQIHALVLSAPNTIVLPDQADVKTVDMKTGLELSVYPNPTSENTNLIFRSDVEQRLNIQIIDITGKTTGSFTQNIDAGLSQIELSTSDLPAGIYQIIVRSDKGFLSETLVIE